MEIIHTLNTPVIVPAYDSKKRGTVFNLILNATNGKSSQINAIGSIAISLRKSLERILYVMSSLKREWEVLDTFEYNFICSNPNVLVRDARSASLALAISLLNIYRQIQRLPINNLIGTGIVRIDGTIENSRFEHYKHQAVLQHGIQSSKFLTSRHCNHLFELEAIMDKNSSSNFR